MSIYDLLTLEWSKKGRPICSKCEAVGDFTPVHDPNDLCEYHQQRKDEENEYHLQRKEKDKENL